MAQQNAKSMRTFIAIELPPPLRRAVVERQRKLEERLRADGAGNAVRWTAEQNLHLTLRFLGTTDDSQRMTLDRLLQSFSNDRQPFSLSIGSFGCFPSCLRPNIVWLAIDGNLDELVGVQAQVEQAARRAGFVSEEKPFKAHLTIGRIKRNADRILLKRAGELLQQLSAMPPAPQRAPVEFVVEEIVLMRSDLQTAGPVYSQLGVYRLGAGGA